MSVTYNNENSNSRIASMDQFRGYTITGMFAVNFLASFTAIHAVMKHNNTYFSYADSIMPSFIFAVGFTFRLTYLKRRRTMGAFKTALTYIKRSFALVLVSLMFFGTGSSFRSWDKFFDGDEFAQQNRNSRFSNQVNANQQGNIKAEAEKKLPIPRTWKEFSSNKIYAKSFGEKWKKLALDILKSDMWETLAVIGVTQLFVLPWIGAPPIVRFLALILCGMGHAYLTHLFNWEFVHGFADNWMVEIWGTRNKTSWDGGFFGIISWSVAMLAGTLCYDIMASSSSSKKAFVRILGMGVIFMVVGYAMSCLSNLYDVDGENGAKASREPKSTKSYKDSDLSEEEIEKLKSELPKSSVLAESPVWPPFENAKGRSWSELLALPPLMQPVDPGSRNVPQANLSDESKDKADKPRVWLKNYWMMGKRVVDLPFITFSTGFAFTVYALFILLCDVAPLKLGVFRTFGMNPLAAYIIHEIFMISMLKFNRLFPGDSPLWFTMVALAFFMFMVYLFVRSLEKQNIYIRM